jgi:hypothetical protein
MDIAIVICGTIVIAGLVGAYITFPRKSAFISADKFPELQKIKKISKRTIRGELEKFIGGKRVDEGFALLYDWEHGAIVPPDEYPTVYDALQEVNDVMRIFVAKIKRTNTSVRRMGYSEKKGDETIRALFPIVTPPGNSDIFIGKQMRVFKEKIWVIFDDVRNSSEISNEDENKSLLLLGVDLCSPEYSNRLADEDGSCRTFFHKWNVSF